jgi:hypothetical protein
MYTYTWDLRKDWNVAHTKAKHRFLRNKLLYSKYVHSLSLSPVSFLGAPTDARHRTRTHATPHDTHAKYYYFAMVSNLLLRCSWTLSISNTNVWPVSPVLIPFRMPLTTTHNACSSRVSCVP